MGAQDRTQMIEQDSMPHGFDPSPARSGLSVRLASDCADIEAAQKLRWDVFRSELGANLSHSRALESDSKLSRVISCSCDTACEELD